jgi:gliding motility-associated-like protein
MLKLRLESIFVGRWMRIFVVFLLCLLAKPGKADHVMGADMGYKCLGNGKFKIIITFYRDCRGAAAPPSWSLLYWYAGNNGGQSTSRYSLSLSRVSIRDITPRCSTASSPCSPTNTDYTGEGVEEHIYEANIDITKSPFSTSGLGTTYCDLTIAYNQCCRNAAITTGATWEDFWTTTTINICNVNKSKNKCNTSPQLSNVPIAYACCNQAYYYNNGAIDTVDYDSLSYRLAPALSGVPNTSVPYSTPFSSRYPVTPYCVPPTTIKCSPQTSSKPPRGFHFDTSTGDIIFTPTKCDEVAVLVIEITEWRRDTTNKWQIVGRTRRDMQIIVKDDCGYNKAPTLAGPYSYKVCEGETIKFKVESDDETFTPNQTVPDTTSISWNNGIPGAKFTVASKTNWPEKRKAYADFEWTPGIGMASDVAYSFTAKVSDNHCPKPSISIRGYKVKVNPRAFSKRSYTQLKCGRFVMTATVASTFKGSPTFRWSVRDSLGKGEIFYSAKKTDTMTFYKGGKYIIVHTVNNSDNCPTIYRDTVIIPDPPVVTMATKDTFACKGTTMNLYANVLFGKSPFSYYWTRITKDTGLNSPWKAEKHNDGDTLKDLTIPNINRDSTIRVRVKDGDGCIFYDTVTIFLKPLPVVSLGPDQRICTYQSYTFDAQHADTVKYKWNRGDTTRTINVNIKGRYIVEVMETKWQCKKKDTVELFVNDTVVSLAGADKAICNQKSTTLDATHRPSSIVAQYTWSDITGNKTLGSNTSYSIKPANTNTPGGAPQFFDYDLYTKVTQGGVTCEDRDTIRVRVNALPFVKWDPKPLKSQCFVYGDIEVNNFFNRGKENGVRIWAFENKLPNNVYTKPSTTPNPGAGSAFNMVDSVTTTRHRFKTTALNNAQLQNGNSFQGKVYGWYKDTNGCINIDSVIQRINGNPMVDLADSTFCQDLGEISMDAITRRPKVKIGIKMDWTILQSPGGIPSSILYNNNPLGSPDWRFRFGAPAEDNYQGTYKFGLCVEDQITGCRTCDTVKVEIIPEPTIKVTSPNPVCVNWDTMELYQYITVNGVQARNNDGSKYEIIEYNYDRNDPKVKSTQLIQGHYFKPSFGVGTWFIRYSNAATGCLKQDSFYIYVNDTPNAVLLAPITICNNGVELDLSSRINTAQTKPATATAVWSAVSSGLTLNGSKFKPFTQGTSNNVEGPYNLRFTYTDNNGCSDTETYNVSVRNQPEVSITTPDPAQACEGTPFAIQSTTKYVGNKVKWTKEVSVDGNIDNPFNENINFQNGSNDAAAGIVKLMVTTEPIANDVCPPATDTITILLHKYPVVDPLSSINGCVPLNTNWSAVEKSGIPQSQLAYHWDFGNGDTSNLQNPTNISYDVQGKYSVALKVINTLGPCVTTKYGVNNVQAFPIPQAYFSTDPPFKTTVALPKFRIINQSTIPSNPFNPILNYKWDFGTGNANDTSTAREPRFAYGKDTATYKIRLITTSNHGCADTFEQPVYIGPDIIVFIPNVFTPDGVGPAVNNRFTPTAQNFLKGTLYIYNRWGEILHKSEDLQTGWDGNSNGVICPQGVYAYYLELYSLDMKKLEFRGTVTLLR